MSIRRVLPVLLVAAAGAWPRAAAAQGFVVTTTSGLEAVRATRAPDWWLSGAGLIDLDGDGDLDLFLSSHGSYGSLTALNDGKGHFTLATGTFPKSELLLPADVDNDGKVDFVATYEDGGGQWWLMRPMPGVVSFFGSSVTRDGGQARQEALMDVDGDGKIDWLRGAGAGVLIDKGDGMGGFTPMTSMIANPGGEEISIVPCDVDGDGDQDVFVEFGRYDTYGPDGATRLYRNDGGGKFVDVTTDAGLYQNGFALQGIGDFDQDGDTDLIALESRTFPHSIYLNDGHGKFTKKAGAVTGLDGGKAEYASWGLASMTDFDNDGVPDIIVDGRVYLHVLRGMGGGTFAYANETWGGIVDIAEASVDNGFTFGDIDGDGDLDLIGYKTIDPVRDLNVYVNQMPAQNWVNVRPVGLPGNHPAAGAEIRVYAAGTTQLLWFEEISLYDKQVQQPYYAFGDTERHYGLGARPMVDVTVRFHPSNKVVRHDGVAANSTVRISEDGAGTIVPPPLQGGSDGG
ncbi:MAG TPA: VCBS repeat-containing protein, partial [Polyangia bacterium]|nr:VCBS repeat-containing protein [Polyangia bacterium]